MTTTTSSGSRSRAVTNTLLFFGVALVLQYALLGFKLGPAFLNFEHDAEKENHFWSPPPPLLPTKKNRSIMNDARQPQEVNNYNDNNNNDKCVEYKQNYPRTQNPRYFPTTLLLNESLFDLWTNRTYLPSPELLQCAKTVGPSVPWQQAFDVMRRRAEYLQSPEDCGKPRGVFSLNKKKYWHLVKFGPHGHGALVLPIVWNVGLHWDHGLPVLASTSHYRFSDVVCGRGWTCHMSPLSPMCDFETTPLSAILQTAVRRVADYVPLDEYCSVSHGKDGKGYLNVTHGRCQCPTGTVATRKSEYNGCRPEDSYDKDSEAWEMGWWESLKPRVMTGEVDPMTDSEHFFGDAAPGELFPQESGTDNDPALTSLESALSLKKHYAVDVEEAIRLGIVKAQSDDGDASLEVNVEGQPHRTLGFLWWWSHVAYLLHHPDSADRDDDSVAVDKSTNFKPGWLAPRHCIAVHIRRGDSCNDPTAPHRKCHPISSYLAAIKKFSNYYGVPEYIYVATDDDNAIEEVRNGTHLTVRYQQFSRAKYNKHNVAIDDPDEAFSNAATLDELYQDIHEMVRCDALVGSWTTSLLVLTYGLMVARKGYYPPVISVDFPYGHESTTVGGSISTRDNVYAHA